MSGFSKVMNFGIKDDFEASLVQKIKLSNILAIVLLGMMLIYSIIAYFVVSGLGPFLIPGYLIYGSVLLLNYNYLNQYGRFVMSIAPSTVIALIHSSMLGAEDPHIESVFIFQVCTLILPWTLLDIEEWISMVAASAITFFTVFGFPLINQMIDSDVDGSMFNHSFIWASVILGGIGILFFVSYFQQQLQHYNDDQNKALLARLESENALAREREEEAKSSMSKLEEAQKEERKRAWATEGIAEVASLLRSVDDLKVLTDKIISFVVRYLKANQGGLYTVNYDNPEKPFIELISCYAFERKKYLKKRIEVGEGIVGQSYLEKDHIFLKEIPQNFLMITSGLGDAPPRNLLVTPMIIEDKVHGLFEIASFTPFEQHEIEFMMKLGENIALALNNIHINEQTKKLLAESQGQTEELRAQEEEMRQNMEELAATQEEMKRSAEEEKRRDEKLQAEMKLKMEKMHFQEEALRKNMQEMHATQEEMSRKVEELKVKDEKMELLNWQMGERLKELQGINDTIHILQSNKNLQDKLTDICKILPPAWQYPEDTVAVIEFGDIKVSSHSDFEPNEWALTQPFTTKENKEGSLTIYYTKEYPLFDEGPFLKEERTLIKTLTHLITEHINASNTN